MHRIALVFLFAASAFAERVTFKTSDGVEIVADYVKGAKDAPAVLCIPMYRNVRATYLPLVIALKEKKFHILVLDARGHGESAPELKKRVEARDPKVFNAMHLDVEAGHLDDRLKPLDHLDHRFRRAPAPLELYRP